MTVATIFAAVFSTAVVYVVAVFIWMAGRYFGVFPVRAQPYDFVSLFLPPVVLPVAYLMWFVSVLRRRPPPTSHVRQRFVQLAIAAGLSVVVAGLQLLFGGANAIPAAVAGIAMLSVSAVALVRDRDVRTALLIAMIAFVAIVPVVIAGRVIAIGVLSPFSGH
jgi:hypothetical protein